MLFRDLISNFKNDRWGSRRARGAERRPEERSDEGRPERGSAKKMLDTQPNPRYSAKNNDAIRMISLFMPNYSFILNK